MVGYLKKKRNLLSVKEQLNHYQGGTNKTLLEKTLIFISPSETNYSHFKDLTQVQVDLCFTVDYSGKSAWKIHR